MLGGARAAARPELASHVSRESGAGKQNNMTTIRFCAKSLLGQRARRPSQFILLCVFMRRSVKRGIVGKNNTLVDRGIFAGYYQQAQNRQRSSRRQCVIIDILVCNAMFTGIW